MKKILHMKKRRLFSLFMVICFIVGIGISVYDVSMKKMLQLDEFHRVFSRRCTA